VDPERPRHDALTIVAIALLAYVIGDVLHEAVGHGGACLLVGGRPLVLSTVHFECDSHAVGAWGERFIAAGGTLVNLCAGALALLARRRAVSASGTVSWFLWLLMAVNLLSGTGYFLFSGVGGIGDWADFVQGLGPVWMTRLGLTLLGGVTYWLVVLRAVRALDPFLSGDGEARVRSATRLTLPAYLAGGTLSCIAGLLNPVGMILVAISAAAASFGGTSGLAWMPQLLHGKRAASGAAQLFVSRSWGWIVLGAVAAAVFVLVLGPGVRFGAR
jgi:putative intracellular protease/amidase